MLDEVVLLLFFGFLIFMLGAYLLFSYRNMLRLILGVETMAKGITLVLLAAGVYRDNISLVQTLIVTFIIVETILAAIMLGIVVISQRIYGSLDVRLQSKLRG